MILLEVRNFFNAKPSANLMELSYHFQKTPDTMRFILEHWIRKGRLRITAKPAGCGTKCLSCKEEYAETYIWIG